MLWLISVFDVELARAVRQSLLDSVKAVIWHMAGLKDRKVCDQIRRQVSFSKLKEISANPPIWDQSA